MKILKIFWLLTLLLFQINSLAQNTVADSLLSKIPVNYFELNRKNFHLQLNKNTYLTDEDIWFKGFVFNEKLQESFTETTNVHVNLLDINGVKIASKLCFASNGIFDGNFKLNDKLISGFYYLQVYTNWSNNFSEDESSLFKVEIINTTTGKADYKLEEPQVTFHPEGGIFVENTDNIIGISVTDCLENGIEITDAKLLDADNNEIITFKTNVLGYGQFAVNNAKNQSYKIRYNYKNKDYEKALLLPQKNGIALTVNNYANEKNVFITLKTNENTLEKEKLKDYYFVINQNDQLNFFKFKLEKTVQNITLPEGVFYDGINIIRLLDSNNNQLNERIIYKKYENTFDVNYFIVSKTKDSVKIAATFLNKVAIGISVLPKETKAIAGSQSIFNSLQLSSYLKKNYRGTIEFFNDPTRKNHYILDLLLLCQKSKYDWNTMKNPPKENYSFNRGLTLKGTVNSAISGDGKIEMFSFSEGINESTYLNDKKEFYFRNFIAIDSTSINFTLKNDKDQKLDLNFYAQLISEDKPFTKNFTNPLLACEKNPAKVLEEKNTDFPTIKNATLLDEVAIKAGVRKKELDNRFRNGNNNMRGFKISDTDYKMYTFLIPFLNSNGFNAGSRMGSVYITSRIRNSLTSVNSPTVYLDDMELQELDMLDNFSMQLIDEIFIDKYATNINSKSGGGVIKIYTNQNYKTKAKRIQSKNFVIKNGFSPTAEFKNPDYDDVTNEAFKNYGTISWIPNNERVEKAVQFTIPTLGQKEITLFTEGISEDGKMISNSKTITVE